MNKDNGITLVALVVSIVVLLILSSVSRNLALGDNGIITKAKESIASTNFATEKEALQRNILAYQMEKTLGESSKYFIGEVLKDKTIENGNSWNIIYVNNTEQNYGTGWNFVAKNTLIQDFGNSTRNWLLNYETGDLIQLEDEKYTNLKYGMNLSVTDSLILNLDPTMIEDGDKDTIKNQMRKNVELINFDWNAESGITKKSFNFDGVNDYIKIAYNGTEEKEQFAQNGFTFEFYGIINGGTSYDKNGNIYEFDENGQVYRGIFCYWNGVENNQARLRFGIDVTSKAFKWNAGYANYTSDYSGTNNNAWNIFYPQIYEQGKKAYYTITLDCSKDYEEGENDYYKAIFYKNGEKVYEGKYNKQSWERFVLDDLQNLSYFCIGRSSMNKEGDWHYSKMNTYALRLYSRGLTEQEAKDNYNKSVAYYDSIINNK